EDEESYFQTEIAIILDGSGSIDPPDFELAKNFIYNMMETFYEKCLECVFALVQYGYIIQTEFDLQVDKASALRKVRAVKQVGNVTRTASAMQHVLDSIFSASHGSQKKSDKIILVLTDGEILMDELDLKTVISSSEMAGIERYAIGVGEAFNRMNPLQELRLIASDPDESHLFRVTNYSALNVLLSTLEQKFFQIEGMAGNILEFELAESGFSVHFPDEKNILFGAVGAFDWSGGVLLHNPAKGSTVFLNESKEATDARNGYLGYKLGSVNTGSDTLMVAGAPRRGMTGRVLVFEDVHLKQSLNGTQVGSYYGSEFCLLDINQDGITDYLLVGAPFFHVHGEEGKVYLYHFDKETKLFSSAGHLAGDPSFPFARFGFAMAAIGDIDANGFGDVAIGAPLEGHEPDSGSSGSIYIFNGGKDGIHSSFSQRITAAQTGVAGLMYFGRSVAGGLDFTEDGLLDLVVGSLGNVILLRSRPVVQLAPTMEFTPRSISDFQNRSTVLAKLCFKQTFFPDASQPGIRNLLLNYTVDLDVNMGTKRAQFEDEMATIGGTIPFVENLCPQLQLSILPCTDDCFSNITLRLSYRLHASETDLSYPSAMLDFYQVSEVYFQLPYTRDCVNQSDCAPRLSLAVQTEEELVVGFTKELEMNIYLANRGGGSYLTYLVLQYPANLHMKNILKVSTPVIQCVASELAPKQFSSLSCKVGHPVFKANTAHFSVIWQLDGKRFPGSLANLTVSVNNTNSNSTTLIEERSLRVKYAFSAILGRPIPTVNVILGDGSLQSTHFTFNINGKNPFGVPFHLRIWIPIMIDNQPLANVMKVTGRQNSTVCKTETGFSQNGKMNFGKEDPQSSQAVTFQAVNCTITSEREEVTVTAEMPLADSLQVLKENMELEVLGEIIFDSSHYMDLKRGNHKAKISVKFLKQETPNFLPAIIGSSVAGFVTLIFIIFCLYKCGFFKRKYKAGMEQRRNS
ncbi:integrin alpha-E, partial [Varanus komodoensis]|uniref:integrin alpha-E n=1 Tax=Varanus komodoensis TaxID=61221 RepID=UPI001CF768A1